MNNFNSHQKSAIESTSPALLVIAGAGTGKTHTLVGRISFLLKKGVKPSSICAITFTNKAAKEMKVRLDPILEEVGARKSAGFFSNSYPFIGTFHSLGARILRKEAPLLGRNKNFIIFDEQDALSLIKKIIKEKGFQKKMFAAESKRVISSIKNKSITSIEADKVFGDKSNLFRELYLRYEDLLRSHNAFDFDDLLFVTHNYLAQNKNVLDYYHNHFQHYLVDEYQDVNTIQYDLLKVLVPPRGSLGVVGDENQTIYSWRGSNIKTFLEFPLNWKEAEVIILNDHYRSTKKIIEATSALIKNNQQQLYPERRGLVTENSDGEQVLLYEALNDDSEADWIVTKIVELRVVDRKMSVAVLYRTNAQSRAIEQALIAYGLPYVVFGGVRFYERKEIRDVVAALRYFSNKQDEISKDRLEKAFGKRRWREIEPGINLISTEKPREFLEKFLEESGYFEYLSKSFTNDEERKENIQELLDFASRFTSSYEFLEEVTLLQSTDKFKEEDSLTPVFLSTVHLAKGLEFDTVFIAGCSEGILPHARSLGDDSQLEEERRLLYVAMTRARKLLHLSFSRLPSRFLSEIPTETMDFQSALFGTRSLDLDDEERYISID